MISIVIPTLNEEKIIGSTLDSLEAHFTLPHEIIISDGNSTDSTVAIARKYTDKIVLYSDLKRQTIAQGRNAGAAIAHGSFLVFLDADCTIMNPDEFFKIAIARFQEDNNLVALTVSLRILPQMETLTDKIILGIINFVDGFINNTLHKGHAPGEFQMMTRKAFDRVGGFNEKLIVAEDVEMFEKLSRIGKTLFESSLTVFQTGRRVHQVGWFRVLLSWAINAISNSFLKKSFSKEWKEIR